MANRCESLDPTSWSSYLPAPAPSSWPHGAAWFSPAAATFGNDALASAFVRASSMSPSSPTPSTSTTTTSSASELSSSIPQDAPRPPLGCASVAASGARPPQARCRTGRVISKRKPRPSRRAAATYITADPADFRRMVQEITGFQVVPGADRRSAAESSPAPPRAPAELAFVLPTLDTSASFLFDGAPAPPQPEEDRRSGRAATTASAEDDWSLLLMQELEAPAVASAFPTLESWGMI